MNQQNPFPKDPEGPFAQPIYANAQIPTPKPEAPSLPEILNETINTLERVEAIEGRLRTLEARLFGSFSCEGAKAPPNEAVGAIFPELSSAQACTSSTLSSIERLLTLLEGKL